MKPKEFDDLLKQKFDQNDFAYNPRSWDQLAEQLDGRAKKRSAMVWWLMPLAGIAASVTMAMGITSLLRQPATGLSGASTAFVQSGNFEKPQLLQNEPSTNLVVASQPLASNTITTNNTPNGKNTQKQAPEKFAISYENAIGFAPAARAKKSKFALDNIMIPKKEKKEIMVAEGYNTFKPEEEIAAKPVKTSVILSGGISHGSQTSGYSVGGTIRHMINDKVFIESDVAFTGTNNSTSKQVPIYNGQATARVAGSARGMATEDVKTPQPQGPQYTVGNVNESYNLYYAQVSPGIGYKIMKNLAIGAGPDFQQMLVDNRPAPSTIQKSNIAEAPMFDVGMIGRTEYSVTKKVKAGVMYRKGINNFITPNNQYIDRDYLQFQLKYSIFNK